MASNWDDQWEGQQAIAGWDYFATVFGNDLPSITEQFDTLANSGY